MANFRYQVLDAAGKQSSGVLEAQSIADASRKLKAEGRYVLKVELDKGPGLMNLELGSKKLNTKELVLISRQLSSLLSAGITIRISTNRWIGQKIRCGTITSRSTPDGSRCASAWFAIRQTA